jgi:hypothetical protein
MGDNVKRARAVYDAFATGDVPAVLAAMDPKIDWREPASLPFDDQVGPDAIAANTFGAVFSMLDSFSVTPSEIFDAGDDVFATGVYRGTGKTTGRELEADFVHHWRFGADGKITYFRTYTDTAQWLEALGT